MGILRVINDERFNMFFSFIIGIGIICMIRPICRGEDCNVQKAPSEKDFDKYVYRLGNGKCYEFKTNIVECPVSGTIEGFRECANIRNNYEPFSDIFSRRTSPLSRCE